jgi:hypothetical protein
VCNSFAVLLSVQNSFVVAGDVLYSKDMRNFREICCQINVFTSKWNRWKKLFHFHSHDRMACKSISNKEIFVLFLCAMSML